MAHMNGGFEKHGLDEDAFGPKGGFSNLKTFDAFRKLAPTRCFAARFVALSSSPFVPANSQFHQSAWLCPSLHLANYSLSENKTYLHVRFSPGWPVDNCAPRPLHPSHNHRAANMVVRRGNAPLHRGAWSQSRATAESRCGRCYAMFRSPRKCSGRRHGPHIGR
jgi:hypothetical protein